MKKDNILWMALGSLITILFSNFISPLIEIFYGDQGNQYTLRTTKLQSEVNEINRNDQEKQEKLESPLANVIGFVDTDSMEEYYEDDDYDDEDDDYED